MKNENKFDRLKKHLNYRKYKYFDLIHVVLSPILTKKFRISSKHFQFDDGSVNCNPSILKVNDGFIIAIRRPNFFINPDQSYNIASGILNLKSDTVLMKCDSELNNIISFTLDDIEIIENLAEAKNGLEDPRIFMFGDKIMCLWSALRIGPQHKDAISLKIPDWNGSTNIMILGELLDDKIFDPLILDSPYNMPREKNWMPFVDGKIINFVYLPQLMEIYNLISGKLELAQKNSKPLMSLMGWSGSSQLVDWDGDWICIVHYACRSIKRVGGLRGPFYFHRFVKISRDFQAIHASKRFFFEKKGVEFCAGIAVDGDRVICSYGVDDQHVALLELRRDIVNSLFK